MTPRELIGTAEVPGGEPLRLFRRGGDYMIVLERNELMSTRMRGSEVALAEMTLERLGARPGKRDARLLIGGYGMGFTLRAALAGLGAGGAVTVAELVPGIIDWARGPMAELTAGCLDDPRVRLVMGDVGDAIGERAEAYDGILLDVDNGPDGLTRLANDRLYTASGLAAARRALRPGGVLAVWSAGPDPAFAKRMAAAGLAVEEVAVRARENGKGPRHVIWFGTKGRG
ncbi:spermidine synthase [Sphingomonas sp.]|uniref:spermidine synthase n=1 Tax=Sphingomonas sp. TaxID=28214 RepID=UPI001B0D4FC1|nr:spermidine synthase [Sphingomonas sp.]MBO9715064.1 spermidine synthase [Sphingomonas sp.]